MDMPDGRECRHHPTSHTSQRRRYQLKKLIAMHPSRDPCSFMELSCPIRHSWSHCPHMVISSLLQRRPLSIPSTPSPLSRHHPLRIASVVLLPRRPRRVDLRAAPAVDPLVRLARDSLLLLSGLGSGLWTAHEGRRRLAAVRLARRTAAAPARCAMVYTTKSVTRRVREWTGERVGARARVRARARIT